MSSQQSISAMSNFSTRVPTKPEEQALALLKGKLSPEALADEVDTRQYT